MAVKAKVIVGLTIALLLVGILLPIGLTDIIDYNGSYTNSSGSIVGTNTTMATLVATIIPVMAVISIIMMFLANRDR